LEKRIVEKLESEVQFSLTPRFSEVGERGRFNTTVLTVSRMLNCLPLLFHYFISSELQHSIPLHVR
jgi:hypothetical protein